MQTGPQIETQEDQSLKAVSSMVVAWCTHHQGLRRLFRCRAQSRKHMPLLQPSWMQLSSESFCVGFSKYAFSCTCTLIPQQQGVFFQDAVRSFEAPRLANFVVSEFGQ